jgi:hypothetical protein
MAYTKIFSVAKTETEASFLIRNMHFGMKLCNDQRNAQVFNLFIYLLLPYEFRASY